MIRDIFVPVAEALFWFTGGELLVNTLWFFGWVLGGTFLMLIPFYLALTAGKNRSNSLSAIVSLISFLPMLMLIVSPGIIQVSLMQECRTVSAEVTIEGVTETQNVRQCRVKENFYDSDYGVWQRVE
jgi:hypothetical protein